MTETSDRFNPTPNSPYGRCEDCDRVFETRKEVDAHLWKTMPTNHNGDPSHSVRLVNLGREERIRKYVAEVISEAIDDAIDTLAGLTDPWNDGKPDATAEEITSAIAVYDHFNEAWDDYARELDD